MSWTVEFYQTEAGQEVVLDFVHNLQMATQAKVARGLALLKTHGADLGMPHTKFLGNGLLELRIRGRQEVRVLYIYAIGKRIIVLHAFVKKTQKTPRKELKIARDRQKEIERS